MHFGYSIIYVASVPETLAFYDKAFGLQTGFLHESELYGELKTGATTLAFAADEMATVKACLCAPIALMRDLRAMRLLWSRMIRKAHLKRRSAPVQWL